MNLIKRMWIWLKTPSGMAIGGVLSIGFIVGVIFWVSFTTGLAMTNSEAFCISCHVMEENVYQEYTTTIHYTNRTGVQATCPDCHVPKEFIPKIKRKIAASKELYSMLMGTVDTPQKFDANRLRLAENEWARLKANNSQECRNCHKFDYMDLTLQKPVAATLHTKAVQDGMTCIDCHKGISHKLPQVPHQTIIPANM